VKSVSWNTSFTLASIITKTQVILVNKQLEVLNSQKETAKIKTGCWDSDNNAFIYSTATHIKYLFVGSEPGQKPGASGTFKSLEEPQYVAFFMKNQVYAFNRQGELVQQEVNNTDYMFKLALQQKKMEEVKEILGAGNLCGHSIVGYLKEQGHAEIALFFEQDVRQRFNLAIASGNL
jgi:coatomer protein complex subunit alpha (xenin)